MQTNQGKGKGYRIIDRWIIYIPVLSTCTVPANLLVCIDSISDVLLPNTMIELNFLLSLES